MSAPASLADLRELLAGLGTTVGQVVSCYVRARVSGSGWTYFLVPFGTPATPLPIPIFFTGAAPGTSINGAHGVVTATLEPISTAGGTVVLTVVVDLTAAPATLVAPQLEFVACTEQTILPGTNATRLEVAIVATGDQTTSDLARKIQLAVALPPTNDRTTVASITATADLRAGQTTNTTTISVVDGPVEKVHALLGTPVPVANLPAGLSTTLQGIGGGILGGILGGGSLTAYVDVADVLTVDSERPFTGTTAALVWKPALAGGQARASARLTTPWTPPTRPAVAAGAATNTGDAVRYAVAGVRADGSETPVSAPSRFVRPAAAGSVQLTLPPKPAKGQLTAWSVYRSRLLGDRWGPYVGLGVTHPFGATVTDATPHQDEAGLVRALPTSVFAEWGQPASVSPAAFPLDATVITHDEELDALVPPARPGLTATITASLPPTLSLDVAPGRALTDASVVTLVAPADLTAVHVVLDGPRSGLHLDASSPRIAGHTTASFNVEFGTDLGGHVAWAAGSTTHLDASAALPTSAGLVEVPFAHLDVPRQLSVAVHNSAPSPTTRVVDAAAVLAGGALHAEARVRMPDAQSPLLIDAAVDGLAPTTGMQLVTPAPGAVAERVAFAWGVWANAPTPGAAPSATPVVDAATVAAPTTHLRLRVENAPPAGTDLVTTPAPVQPASSALAAIALRQATGAPTQLDVNVDGLRHADVAKAAGDDLAVDAAITVDAPCPARVQIHNGDGPNTVHTRVRRFGPRLHVRVGHTTFGSTTATVADDSDPVDGLRLWSEAGGVTGSPDRPVGTHTDIDASPVSTIVAEVGAVAPRAGVSIDPAGPAPAAGTDEARPVRASFDAGVAGTTEIGIYLHTGGADPALPTVDVAAQVPDHLGVVAGGSAGTLAPISTATQLVDNEGGFDASWLGRSVQWATGQSTITNVVDATQVQLAPGAAAPGPDFGDVATNWYRLVDDPAVTPALASPGTGARIRTGSAPLRARLGVELRSGWGLLGVGPGPRLRTDQPDDTLIAPGDPAHDDVSTEAGLGAFTIRAAGLAAADFSAWFDPAAGDDLLGALHRPPANVLERPQESRWTVAVVKFAPATRANRGLGVAFHDTEGWDGLQPGAVPPDPTPGEGRAPMTPGQRDRATLGRNAFALRLAEVPDEVTLRVAPDVVALDASGALGPGFAHTETAQWLRGAPFGEAGYSRIAITQIPRRLTMASGWRMPDMGGGVDSDDHYSFGELSNIASYKLSASRIAVGVDDLVLGRFSTVAWDTFRDGNTPWVNGRAKWSLTDIWFLTIHPMWSVGDAELVVYKPGEPQTDGKSAFELSMHDGTVLARIFKVKLTEQPLVPGRRAAIDAATWTSPKLESEIQLGNVLDNFAVNMDAYTHFGPPWGQEDETNAGDWWMVAYDQPIDGFDLQFGSSFGNEAHRAPVWDPYWA
jgi:hypothetical protein